MKCLKNSKTGNIVRVSDDQARQMVGQSWAYVSKTEWKSVSRVPVVVVEEKQPEVKEAKKIKIKKK